MPEQEADALALARRTIDAFERANVDTIVINAAGCGSTVKEYGHLLRDDPDYAERAAAFAAKCQRHLRDPGGTRATGEAPSITVARRLS